MNQKDKTLFKIINGVDKNIGKEDYITCMKPQLSQNMYQLINVAGLKVDDAKKIMKKITEQVKVNQNFLKELGLSFLTSWIKFQCINELGLKKPEIITLLKHQDQLQIDKLKQYFLRVAEQCQIKDFADEAEELVKKYNEDNDYKIFKKNFKEANDQQLKQEMQKLKQMKNQLPKMKFSKLDLFIQENLISSFEDKCMKMKKNSQQIYKANYTQENYKKFKQNILKLCMEFGIVSNQIKAQLDIKLGEGQDYYNKILNIRSKIHPVYIPELISMIQKNKSTKNLVKDKNIVVLLGVSGAGKSTCVQMMLGYSMTLSKNSRGLTTLIPVGGLKQEHKQFVAKASTKSVTKYASAIKLNFVNEQGQIYLVDTPGFFDSGGLVVDACNGLSTVRVLASAASVRFVFLVNQKSWGTKGKGFKDLAKVISKLFVKYDKNKVIYFLNCYNKEQLLQLPNKVDMLQEQLNAEQRGDTKYVNVIQHFKQLLKSVNKQSQNKKISIQQAIKQNKQLVVMNPFSPNLKLIQQKILNEHIKTGNPKSCLSNIINEEVRQALRNQANILEKIIKSCLKIKDMEAAIYYFSQLNDLAKETVKADDIAQAGNKIDSLVKQLKQDFDKLYSELSVILEKKVTSLRIDQITINQAKKIKQNLLQLQANYKKIPQLKDFSYSKQIEKLIKQTSKKLMEKHKQRKSKQLVETIMCFSKQFDTQLYQSFFQSILQQKLKIQQEILNLINTQNYKNLDNTLGQLQKLNGIVEDIPDLNNSFQEWKQLLKQKNSQRMDKFNDLITQQLKVQQISILKKTCIQKMAKTIQVFSSIDSTQRQQLKQIINNYKKVKKQIITLARKYISQIKKLIISSVDQIINAKGITTVSKSKQNVLEIIKQIKQIEDQVKDQLDTQLSNLAGLVKDKKQYIDKQIQKLQQNSNFIQIKDIYTSIQILNQLTTMLSQEQKKKCAQTINSSKNKLENRLKGYLDEILNKNYTIQTPESSYKEILEMYKISVSIYDQSKINQKQKLDPITQIFKDIKTNVISKMQQLIKSIDMEIQSLRKKFLDQKQSKIEDIVGSVNTFIGIKNIFIQIKHTSFRPYELNEKISKSKGNFHKSIFDFFKKLCTQLIEENNSIAKQFQLIKVGEGVKRQKVYKIHRLNAILHKMKKNSQMATLLGQSRIEVEPFQNQIHQSAQNIKDTAKRSFQQNFDKNKNIPVCYEIQNSCAVLRYLDSQAREGDEKFSAIVEQFRQQLDKRNRQCDQKPETFIQQGNINMPILKKVYKHLSQFQQNSPQGQRLKQIIQKINYVFKRDQDSLVKKISQISRNSKNKATYQLISSDLEDIQIKVQYLFKTVQQLKQIMTNPSDKIPKIQNQTLSRLTDSIFSIMINCQKKINNFIQEGSYQDAENQIVKMQQFQQLAGSQQIKSNDIIKNNIQTKKGELGLEAKKLGFQTEKTIKFADFYKKKLQTIKNNRQQMYLKKQIQIDANFKKQFNTFNKQQKEMIEKNLNNQFDDQISLIVNQLRFKSFFQIDKQFNQTQKKYKYLPINLKQVLDKKIKEKLNNFKDLRKAEEEQAIKQFKFEQCFNIYKKEKRSYITSIYQKKIDEGFQIKLKQIKQEPNFQNLSKILQDTFCTNISTQDLQEYPQFKAIFQKKIARATQHINILLGQKKIKQIKGIFNEKEIANNCLASCQKVKIQIQQFVKILMFMQEKKRNFTNFKQKQCIHKLQQTLDQQQKKNLIPSSINIKNLKSNPNAFVMYAFKAQTFTSSVKPLDVQNKQIKQVYLSFQTQMNQIQNNIKKIHGEIQNVVRQVKKIKVYSESMKSYSAEQRKTYLQSLQQNISSLQGVKQIGYKIFSQNYEQIINEKRKSIVSQVKQGIQRCINEVENGFKDPLLQFSKQIDLTISIANLIPITLTFVEIEKKQIQNLHQKIRNNYEHLFGNLNKQAQSLQEQKTSLLTNIKQVHQKYKEIKTNYYQQQKLKYQQKQNQQKINEQKNLLNETSQSKKQSIRNKCKNNIDQYQRQFRMFINQFNSKQQKKQQKETAAYYQKNSKQVAKYCEIITILYKSTLEINYQKTYYKERLDKNILQDLKNFGRKISNQVFNTLQNMRNYYSSMLIGNCETFKKNIAIKWEAKVKANGIQYILQNLQLNKNKKQKLKDLFKSYVEQFDHWKSKYQQCQVKNITEDLYQTIKNNSNNIKKFYHEHAAIDFFKPEKLLAQIFALWTISNSTTEDMVVQFSNQPHPAQIITIFLTLSLSEDEPRQLASKMAQVGTGQGKSVVLAGLSCYLALCGFQVNCVCYSEYLSTRDRQAFINLFQKLQISNKIAYGTFDSVCQSLLNKPTSDSKGFRQQIKQLLCSKQINWWEKFKNFLNKFNFFITTVSEMGNDSNKKSNKIMVIDEVDVFFDPSFFGSLYCPDVCIQSQQISNLIKYVWLKYKKHSEITDSTIKKSSEFKKIIERYQKIQPLLQDQIKGMVLGCRNVQHQYIVHDDLIQYKNQDGISSKINYGYKTLFSYLTQHDKNRITLSSMERALKISLIICQFSYALLPKYFRSIIGVTGTYEAMSKFKKNYLQKQYQVKKAYIIPSVYGNIQRRLINPTKVVAPENLWQEIISQIKKVNQTGRPVLVFFKTASDLQTFFNCPGYQQLQNKTTFLNQTHRAEDRDMRIKKTCNKANITLMTNSFGRGTDFVVYDESIFNLGEHGGLHVIQTFLSVDESQQVQIQGRTARQGSPGTFSLIIPTQHLQLFQIDPSQIANIQNKIKVSRSKIEDNLSQQLVKMLNQSNAKHQKCIKVFMDDKIDQKKIIDFIHSLNKYPQIRKRTCKTVILVDATASMQNVLKKLLSILGHVVKQTIQIISKEKTASSSQLQIGVYRNYNCSYETLFQSTPFQSQSINLQNFLKGISAEGGWGNEAIQMAYYHVNCTPDIDQVIIIGDAPANNQNETIDKRKQMYGQAYWESKKVPILSSQIELKKIKQKGIPIHSFYISNKKSAAQSYFMYVSKQTGGYAQRFNVDDPNASKKLSKFISQMVLMKSAQNQQQANAMIQLYRKRNSV